MQTAGSATTKLRRSPAKPNQSNRRRHPSVRQRVVRGSAIFDPDFWQDEEEDDVFASFS